MTAAELVPATPVELAAWEQQPAVTWAARFLASLGSPNTRRSYARDLRDWIEFCANAPIDPLAAQRIHVDVFARSLEQAGRAQSTVARKLSALASYYGYLTDEGVLEASPVAHVRRPRISMEGVTPGLTRDEGRRLLEAARDHGSRRSQALLTLLLSTGLRINEALSRDVEHLTYDSGHRILLIERKGRKAGRMPLPPAVIRALDDYLAGRASGPLFATSGGARMAQPEAWRMVRRIARLAGIESAGHLSPHSLRTAFITGARDAGVPLEDVQDAAGHADPRTTRRYDRDRHRLDGHAAYRMGDYFTPQPAREDT